MLVGENVILRTLRETDPGRIYEQAADIRDMGDYWPISMPSALRWKKHVAENGWWGEDSGCLLITDHEDHVLGHILFIEL